MLVRRLKVSKALHWLKLNHVDYYDCEISEKNLASYPEDGPPVVVDYYISSSTNKNPESTSVNDVDEEDGTSEGPCSFAVHGLTGEEFSRKTMKTIKTIALQHLTSTYHWTLGNTRVDLCKSTAVPIWFGRYRPN